MTFEAGRSEGAAPPRSAPDRAPAVRVLHLQMVEAVLAGSGLRRVAELAARAAGGPVAVVVPRLDCCAMWPAGGQDAGALRRYVAARVRGDVTPVATGVAAEAPVAAGDELVGLVVLLRPGDPAAAEVLRAAAVAAMTEVALAEAGEPAEDNLRAALLADVRAGAACDPAELVRRGRRAGCELARGAAVLCARVGGDRPRHVAATAVEGLPGAIAQHLDGGVVHALVPSLGAARTLAERLERHGPVGMSPSVAAVARLSAAYAAAELALALGERTVGALEVRTLRAATVGPIERHDASHGTGLTGTVAAAVEHDGDLRAVASALGIRELILSHRLDRVAELTGLDARAAAPRERLALGLLAARASRLGP